MTDKLTIHNRADKQRGTTLLVALVLLLGVTVFSIASVNTSMMELHIAGSSEASATTFQTAQAALDFTISDSGNLPTSGPLHQPAAVTLTGSQFGATSPDYVNAFATRTRDCGAPPRARKGSSLTAFSAFSYEVSVDIDKTTSGMGRTAMAQGYVLLGPKC